MRHKVPNKAAYNQKKQTKYNKNSNKENKFRINYFDQILLMQFNCKLNFYSEIQLGIHRRQ